MRVLALSGSLRAASSNTALLHGLAMAAPSVVRVTVWDGLAGLPPFSPDCEGPPAPPLVEAFAAQVRAADALVIACPEYAHALPGAFKNALDWLVSRDEIIFKPIALLHASHRGEDVLADLRRVLGTVSQRFLPEVFARLPLMKLTPEAAARHLAEPAQRTCLQSFLQALQAAVGEPGMQPPG